MTEKLRVDFIVVVIFLVAGLCLLGFQTAAGVVCLSYAIIALWVTVL